MKSKVYSVVKIDIINLFETLILMILFYKLWFLLSDIYFKFKS